MSVYREIDRKTAHFQKATGIYCPEGCGKCCEGREIEATPIEMLPLAETIYNEKLEERIFDTIEEKAAQGDPVCVLYQADFQHPGNGKCSYYDFRPLVCRLFGFASRREKNGKYHFVPCKIIKSKSPALVKQAEEMVQEDPDSPVYQDYSLCIAALRPEMGFQRVPINRALKTAIQYLYWKRKRL